MSTFYSIRVRDDADGFYAHAHGEVIGSGMTRDTAESVIRSAPNGDEWEVVEDAQSERGESR